MKTEKTVPVPKVDIDAPLAAQIEKSTEYEGGVTPKNRFLYVLGIFSFIGICLLVGATAYFYLTQFRGKGEEKRVKMVEEQGQIQEETKSFERSGITFEVLNGSGVAGAAKKVAEKIEDLGYKVLKTGNTEETSGNKLYLRADIADFSDEIISDLADFDISGVSGELTEGSASARVVLGTQ